MRCVWLLLLFSCTAEGGPVQAGSTYCVAEGRSLSVVDSLLSLKQARGITTYRRLVTPRVEGYCIHGLTATEFTYLDRTDVLAPSPSTVLWWPQVDVRSGGLTLGLGPEIARSHDGDLDLLSEALRLDLTKASRLSVMLEGFGANPAGLTARSLSLLSDAGAFSIEWTFFASGSEVRPERLRAIGVPPDRSEFTLPGGSVQVRQVLEPGQRQIVIVSRSHTDWLQAVLVWTSARVSP